MQSRNSQYLDVLQILRGIAALMVVVHHSAGSLRFYHKIDDATLDFVGSLGRFGVDFFFVLSGFIISYSAYYKRNRPQAFPQYVKGRLLRIYVPYLPIGLLMLGLYSVFPSLSNGGRDISVLTSVTLLPDGSPALSVAWTLTFELFFYALFCLYFLSPRVWNGTVAAWFALIIIVQYSGWIPADGWESPVWRLVTSCYNLEFILGYLLSLLIIRQVSLPLWSGVLLSAFFFGLAGYGRWVGSEGFPFALNFAVAVGAFVAIFVAIVHFNRRFSNRSVFMMIGNATYSLYLVHNPLQMVLIRFFPKVDSVAAAWGVMALSLIVCTVVGYAYYYVMEKRAMRMLMTQFGA